MPCCCRCEIFPLGFQCRWMIKSGSVHQLTKSLGQEISKIHTSTTNLNAQAALALLLTTVTMYTLLMRIYRKEQPPIWRTGQVPSSFVCIICVRNASTILPLQNKNANILIFSPIHKIRQQFPGKKWMDSTSKETGGEINPVWLSNSNRG